MGKLKTCSRRRLPARLLLILAGALLLLAALAPSANAALLRFYDFEGTPTAPYPVNLVSHAPAVETGAGTNLTLEGTQPPGNPYPPPPAVFTSAEAGIPLNPPPPPPNLVSLGIHRAGVTNLNIEMPFFSATGIYDITSVSFALAGNGNGFGLVQLKMSTDGGATFTGITAGQVILGAGGGIVVTFNGFPSTLNIPLLVLELSFTLGQSNGVDLQNQIDNIQVNGTAVPEPATIAGGLLGVLGLCWFQRRRLIRSVRLRRT